MNVWENLHRPSKQQRLISLAARLENEGRKEDAALVEGAATYIDSAHGLLAERKEAN